MAEEKTFDDLVKELDELEVKVKSGEVSFDDAKKDVMEIIIGQEIKAGNIPFPPLPMMAGAMMSFKAMVEEFLGKEVLAHLDQAAKIAAITAMAAKLMQFIMINASIFTGGLIPAPPNLRVVMRYMEFLNSIAESQSGKDEGKDGEDSAPSGGAQNVV